MKALPQSTERDLWVSWSDYHDLIEQLVLLVDQARFIEREGRIFDFIEAAPPSVLLDVRSILSLLLSLPTIEG